MHALMAAVLLWVAGLDALDLNAEPEPPNGELGEIEEGVRTGEGNAVIGADGLAGFAGDAELAAQPRHLLPVQQPGNKLQTLIHEFTRLPGHLALPAKGPIV
jgi:hypothetical protein